MHKPTNGTAPAKSGETLDSWSFGIQAEARLRDEFPGSDPTTNALMVMLNRASEDLTEAIETQAHKPLGLSWLGYRMLFVLWVVGPLEPAKTAKLMRASRASVSNLSISFIKEGLIERRPSATDRRSVQLVLTPSGVKRVREAFLKRDEKQRELLSALTTEEQQILHLLLAKLVRSRPEWSLASQSTR